MLRDDLSMFEGGHMCSWGTHWIAFKVEERFARVVWMLCRSG